MIKNYDYYQDELDRAISTEYSSISLIIRREDFNENISNSTKWMHLSKDNIDIFINFLQEIKNRMS